MLWGLHEAPVYKGFQKHLQGEALQSPKGFVPTYIHTCTHFGLFPTDVGGNLLWRLHKALYSRGFMKPLPQRSFAMGALQSLQFQSTVISEGHKQYSNTSIITQYSCRCISILKYIQPMTYHTNSNKQQTLHHIHNGTICTCNSCI